MLFTIAVTLKFSEQFHVIRNTIFHTKHMKFLLNKILYKYAKFLASETCDNSILHSKDFEISSLWNFTRVAKFSRNQTLFHIVSYIVKYFLWLYLPRWDHKIKICVKILKQVNNKKIHSSCILICMYFEFPSTNLKYFVGQYSYSGIPLIWSVGDMR